MSITWARRYRKDLAALGYLVLLAFVLVMAFNGKTEAGVVGVLALMLYLSMYDAIRGHGPAQYFVLYVWQDVEPQMQGPFYDADARNVKARELRQKEGPDEGGIYWLDIDEDGIATAGPYTGGFLDDVKEAEDINFQNYYRCPECMEEWSDVWTATCDDDCPKCGTRHISPYDSEELKGGAHGSTIQ